MRGGIHLYVFALNDAIGHYDYLGQAAETIWDWYCVVDGALALGRNAAAGNTAAAALDAAGLTIDLIALLTPGVPGGASKVIDVGRQTKKGIRESKRGRKEAGKIVKVGDQEVTALKLNRGKQFLWFGDENVYTLARNMFEEVESTNDHYHLVRFAVTKKFDEAHHLIPLYGPPSYWPRLREQVECIRKRAIKVGIDLNGLDNGVSISKDLHRLRVDKLNKGFGDKNTLQKWYYEEIVRRFSDITTKVEFQRELSFLADELLVMDKKLPERWKR